ncbi:MAG: TIGR02757 family protein, partial [Bacteroidia bacterium]|nr:TIGR02757 family protein [Bacteroidia bacterium]
MKQEIKALLDEKVIKYNSPEFIENDPILIPHQFKLKEDIEIAGFLAATIAWGNRKSIINNAQKLMRLMDDAPFDFISNYSKNDLKHFEKFVHRTFNGTDCIFFIGSLRNIYKNHKGLEHVFASGLNKKDANVKNAIINFRDVFLQTKHLSRSEKHLSNPLKNSSAKRLCMYLRWMVRKDGRGVDFGIWNSIKPSQLCLPLDVHTGNVSRALKLLSRKQNDWTAVEEITEVLKKFDSKDPIKYDFALFGL